MNDPVVSHEPLARLSERIDEQRRRLPGPPPAQQGSSTPDDAIGPEGAPPSRSAADAMTDAVVAVSRRVAAVARSQAPVVRDHAVAAGHRAATLAKEKAPVVRDRAAVAGRRAVTASRSSATTAWAHVDRRRHDHAASRARRRAERRHDQTAHGRRSAAARTRRIAAILVPIVVLIGASAVAYALFPGGPAMVVFAVLLAPLALALVVLLAEAALVGAIWAVTEVMRSLARGAAGAVTHSRTPNGRPEPVDLRRRDDAPSLASSASPRPGADGRPAADRSRRADTDRHLVTHRRSR